jgi:hypothetical protein
MFNLEAFVFVGVQNFQKGGTKQNPGGNIETETDIILVKVNSGFNGYLIGDMPVQQRICQEEEKYPKGTRFYRETGPFHKPYA